MKAIRIDPGMFVPQFASTKAAIDGVIADLLRWKADAAFVFAYSPIFGAYYKTAVRQAWGTSFLKNDDFLRKFAKAASAKGLKVVASYRLNHYEGAPALGGTAPVPFRPEWRMRIQRQVNGVHAPYLFHGYGVPIHPLSPYARSADLTFADWFQMLVTEAAAIPGLHGLEACEGNVAEGAEGPGDMPDFHPDALASFRLQFPGIAPGGPEWRHDRSAGLTELHARLRKAAHDRGLKAYVIHDLPASNDSLHAQTKALAAGTAPANELERRLELFHLGTYADLTGFDWPAIQQAGYDHHIVSAIWQQRRQDACALGFAPALFSPQWPAVAAQRFRQATGAASVMSHVEITPWPASGANCPRLAPTAHQVEATIKQARANSSGVTIYSYDQLKQKNAQGKWVDNAYATAVRNAFV